MSQFFKKTRITIMSKLMNSKFIVRSMSNPYRPYSWGLYLYRGRIKLIHIRVNLGVFGVYYGETIGKVFNTSKEQY